MIKRIEGCGQTKTVLFASHVINYVTNMRLRANLYKAQGIQKWSAVSILSRILSVMTAFRERQSFSRGRQQ